MAKVNLEKVKAVNFIVDLDKLAERQNVWLNGIYKQSNDELYSILTECYVLTAKARSHGSKFAAALNKELTNRELTFNDGTSLETKVVRLVFGDVKKRATSYAKVLCVAGESGVKSGKLSSWIVDNGGVENVRRTDKAGKTHSQRREESVESVSSALESYKAVKLSSFAGIDESDYTLALVRCSKDGKKTVVKEVRSLRLVKEALCSLKADVDEARAAISKQAHTSKQLKTRDEILNGASTDERNDFDESTALAAHG